VLTEQWAQRLAGTGVHVHAMHPGWADTAGVSNWMPVFRALTRPITALKETAG
jgi:NAD(P)-dependent dehydrogenase (short-subunit alcohol dehydrogenase family)